ncbi:hypothetical protein KI429_26535 [Pseudomonas shirazica]|nr:hypothetical protein KI429_26535 [Pseudomonas shirazica]
MIVALSTLSEQPNLLNFKKFVVPMSLEVGRIIRGFERASTFNFIYLKCSRRRPYQGYQVLATTPSAPMRSSAARAALRSTRLLLHLFRASYSCAIGARTLGAWLEIDEEQQAQPSILNGTDKAVARARHRRDWPETDVGAALCCEAPRGRRSIL